MDNVWDVFRTGQNSVLAPQQAQMHNAVQGMGILAHLRKQKQEEQLQGILASALPPEQKHQALMSVPGGIDILKKFADMQNAGTTADYHRAQIGEIQRKGQVAQGEQQARGQLTDLISNGTFQKNNPGAMAPTSVMLDQDAAEKAAIEQYRKDPNTPFAIDVPDPAKVKALAIASGSALPRSAAAALLNPGVGGNGQQIAPRLVDDPDSPTKWSWMYQDGRKVKGAPAPSGPRTPASAVPAPGDYSRGGEPFLETLPVEDRAFVKKLANYEIDPKTLSTRGGEREKYLRMATQLNPDFDQKNYNAIATAINRFSSGKQGDTVRSFNVAIEHMDTARRLGDALKNADIPLFNKIGNEFATQTGHAAPPNFEAVKEIVADEVVKGVIGGTNAQSDRQAAASKIRAASSPEQLAGVLDSWTELMGGQLRGLEKQYQGATFRKDFRDRYLTGRALDAIGTAEKKMTPTSDVTSPVREFATEADAIKSGVKGKVKIGGRTATID